MEELFRPIVNYFASRASTKAVLLVDYTKHILTAKEMFDVIIYAVEAGQENREQYKHFYLQGMNVGLYIVDEGLFRTKPLQVLNESEVLFERNRFIDKLRKEIPTQDIQLKMGLEFAELIRAYTTGKNLFMGGRFLDAYNLLVKSLNHLARLTLIEKGVHIESSLWSQISSEPEILKLFEELITSEEAIEKRLELVFLASGFLIYSKTLQSTEHILGILKENSIWNYEMFEQHPQIKCYGANLRMLLDYLIEKGLIVPLRIESTFTGMYEQCYKVKKTC